MVRDTQVSFPPLLSLHKIVSSHRDWLGWKCPKLLPLINQDSLQLELVQRDFGKSAQNTERYQILNNETATNKLNYTNKCLFSHINV